MISNLINLRYFTTVKVRLESRYSHAV